MSGDSPIEQILEVTPQNPHQNIAEKKYAKLYTYGGRTGIAEGDTLRQQLEGNYIRLYRVQDFVNNEVLGDHEEQAVILIKFRYDDLTDDDEIILIFKLLSDVKQHVQFFLGTDKEVTDAGGNITYETHIKTLIHTEEVFSEPNDSNLPDTITLNIGMDLEQFKDKDIIKSMKYKFDILIRPTERVKLDFYKMTVNKAK